MALTEPLAEDAINLFKDIESHFPSKSLGEERWQILAVCLKAEALAEQ
jgi:hypothetical protein